MKKILALLLIATTGVFAQDASRVLTGAAQPPLPFNILLQPGFENRTTGWSATGGTFTTVSDTANVARGRYSASWVLPSSTGAGVALQSNLTLVPVGLYGRACRGKLLYKGNASTNGSLSFQVWEENGLVFLGSANLQDTPTYTSAVTGTFNCPTSGSIQVIIKSTSTSPASPAAIYFDEVFVGEAEAIGTGSIVGLQGFGSSPNGEGASIVGTSLILQPASGSQPGGVSTTTQTFAGAKTFAVAPTITGLTSGPVINTSGLLSSEAQLAKTRGGTGISSTATFPSSGTVATVPSSGVVKSNGTALSSGTVNLTSEVANVLPIANGGTGASTANGALTNLLPSQTGNGGKILTTDGSVTSWASGLAINGYGGFNISGTNFTGLSFSTITGIADGGNLTSNLESLLRLTGTTDSSTWFSAYTAYPMMEATGTDGWLNGFYSYMDIKSISTNFEASGFLAETNVGSSKTVANLHGFAANIPNNNGTITNYAGLRIKGVAGGTVTGYNDAIHVDAGRSFFNGDVFIDGAADTVQLKVQGHSTQTSNILAVEKSDATELFVVNDNFVRSYNRATIWDDNPNVLSLWLSGGVAGDSIFTVFGPNESPSISGCGQPFCITYDRGTRIRGTKTNDSASIGYVGEWKEGLLAQASAITLTTATTADVTSITLTAGDWMVSGLCNFNAAAITGTQSLCAITSTSGNSLTGANRGENRVETPDVPTAASDVSMSIPQYHIQLSATTTYYLKAQATFSAGTNKVNGRISAVRIR